MKPGLPFNQKGWNVTAGLAGIILIGYIGFLIALNYFSQLELRQNLVREVERQAEKRATALAYFFSERPNDLRSLLGDRAISGYFENRALGMSMEYGLRASLLSINGVFQQLLTSRTLNGDPVYTQIVFLDSGGNLLVREVLPALNSLPDKDLTRYLLPDQPFPSILIDTSSGENQINVTVPYFFKGRYSGQIIASISSENIYHHLIEEKTLYPHRFVYLVSETGDLLLPNGIPPEVQYLKLPNPSELKPGSIENLTLPVVGGGEEEVLVSCFPLGQLPAALVSIVSASQVYGRTPPWHLPLAMIVLSFLVLTIVGAAWKLNARNLALRIGLEQEARSRRDVEEKNRQLTKEIAERKRAEAALRQSEERYRKFFEDDLSGAFIATPEGLIIACNPAFAKMFGFASVDEILKISFRLQHADQTLHHQYLEKLRADGKLKQFESVYRRSDGQLIHTRENVTGRFDNWGNLVEIKGFLIDYTEQRKLEERIRHSQKMEAIGTLAGGIAHDFNNILTAILGNAEMAKFKTPSENTARQNLDKIIMAGNRARDLVKQILTFSRQTKQEKQPLRLGPIVKEVLKLLRASLPSTIEIRQNISSDVGNVVADPTQIHQVLMNLCTNAAHAMQPEGGVLQVDLYNLDSQKGVELEKESETGRFVALVVSDTGCGMNPETAKRIFDPFFTNKGIGEGSGMGLSVVYGIVKDHGGIISADTEPGKGSVFRILLPRIEAEPARQPPVVTPFVRDTSATRVLLIDDEEGLLEIGKQMLEYLGYNVTCEKGSLEALKVFQSRPEGFDLIITDQTMPKMTGTQLARRLIRIRPDIPIILCTGYNDFVEQESVMEIGIKKVVTKPFIFSELAAIAGSVLNEKEL